MTITTTRHLLTGAWAADVDRVDAALRQLRLPRGRAHDCRVSFFEIAPDDTLHVNVTHRQETRGVKGWTGPGVLPDGFVHNRTFRHASPAEIVRDISEMVLATRA